VGGGAPMIENSFSGVISIELLSLALLLPILVNYGVRVRAFKISTCYYCYFRDTWCSLKKN